MGPLYLDGVVNGTAAFGATGEGGAEVVFAVGAEVMAFEFGLDAGAEVATENANPLDECEQQGEAQEDEGRSLDGDERSQRRASS